MSFGNFKFMILLERRGAEMVRIPGRTVKLLSSRYPHRGEYRESNASFYARLGIWINVPQRCYDIFLRAVLPRRSKSRNLILLTREWTTISEKAKITMRLWDLRNLNLENERDIKLLTLFIITNHYKSIINELQFNTITKK